MAPSLENSQTESSLCKFQPILTAMVSMSSSFCTFAKQGTSPYDSFCHKTQIGLSVLSWSVWKCNYEARIKPFTYFFTTILVAINPRPSTSALLGVVEHRVTQTFYSQISTLTSIPLGHRKVWSQEGMAISGSLGHICDQSRSQLMQLQACMLKSSILIYNYNADISYGEAICSIKT